MFPGSDSGGVTLPALPGINHSVSSAAPRCCLVSRVLALAIARRNITASGVIIRLQCALPAAVVVGEG